MRFKEVLKSSQEAQATSIPHGAFFVGVLLCAAIINLLLHHWIVGGICLFFGLGFLKTTIRLVKRTKK
jgi:hypothetical protein